jgi:hypothetical protein
MNAAKNLENEYIKLLLVGTTGSGKSTLAALTAKHPDLRPTEFYDFDGRIYGIRPALTKEDLEFIEYVTYLDSDSPGSAYDTGIARVEQLISDFKDETATNLPKTVVLDSMSFMQKSAMQKVIHEDKEEIAKMNHYHPQMQYVERFVSKLASLPCNVIVTAHEAEEKKTIRNYKGQIEMTPTGRVRPMVTGNLANYIPGFFNEYWEALVEKDMDGADQFKIRTRRTEHIETRTCFPDKLNEFELQGEIWEKILQAKKEV